MKEFSEFNWELIISFLGAKLNGWGEGKVTFYKFPFHTISVYDNGGEVNIYFECLPNFPTPPTPKGIRVTEYAFDFSIPYTDTYGKISDEEFASRISFFLKKVSEGQEVDILDYFRQQRQK